MNLAIRGILANLGARADGAFDQDNAWLMHGQYDSVIANPAMASAAMDGRSGLSRNPWSWALWAGGAVVILLLVFNALSTHARRLAIRRTALFRAAHLEPLNPSNPPR